MRPCPDRRCHVPDVACHLGEDTPFDCKVWKQGVGDRAAIAQAKAEGAYTLFPWTGTAFGTEELLFLTGRGEARLVAIVGAHNAGKTTLLAAWYQQTGKTGRIGEHLFAGSFTLEGWEAVAHALRWNGAGPSFPPHTSSGAGRTPGMLHLGVRQENGELEDFLFADSPGEWFQRWATDSTAEDAKGARWLSERAAVFIITADCEALSGPGRGSARASLVQLIRRTANERGSRPVALVWTKADLVISDNIKSAITEAARLAIPDIEEFSCSVSNVKDGDQIVRPEESLQMILNWAVKPYPRGFAPIVGVVPTNDPFLKYGDAE